jgi:hypothetical protein
MVFDMVKAEEPPLHAEAFSACFPMFPRVLSSEMRRVPD